MERSDRTRPESRVLDPRAVVDQISRIRQLANQFIEGELVRRGVSGIVPAHGAVLGYLFSQQAPVALKDVVQHVGRAKSTVTQVVAGLERAGYLTKTVSPDDSRVVQVELTVQGRAVRDLFVEISGALLAKVYGDMPPEEQQLLLHALARLEDNLRS